MIKYMLLIPHNPAANLRGRQDLFAYPFDCRSSALESPGCFQSEYTAKTATITLATITGAAFIQMP